MDLKTHLINLQRNPNGFAENYNLGIVFHQSGNLKRAEKFFKRAININAKNPLAYNDLGTVYIDLGKPRLALKSFKKALDYNKGFSDAIYNIGFLYSQYKSKQNLARKYFKRAFDLDPKNSKALAMYYQHIRGSCNFNLKEKLSNKLDKLTNGEIKRGLQSGESPFLHLTRKQDEIENFSVAKSWGTNMIIVDQKKHSHKKNAKLKIGYVSDGLRDFPTGHNFAGVLSGHSKNIHVNIYSWGRSDDSIYEKKIKERADNYVDIENMSDQEASKKIASDNIDILIDLKGHTKDNRIKIFSHKPAQVIVNYLGYPGTTGSGVHDYLIADEVVVPEAQKKYFSETILYLPHCYRPADVTTAVDGQDTSYRPADITTPAKIQKNNNKKFVFASLNTLYKIDRDIFEVWLEILNSVPNSELWILAENKQAIKNLNKHKNIKFLRFTDKKTHLERISQIDLCLDTKVVSGHTTTTDAARVGVPTLCFKGNHFASRVSGSVNHELGLEKLIAMDLAEYKDKAIKYAKNPAIQEDAVHTLNQKIKDSIIFNPKKFAKSLEKIYFSLYKQNE